ncbi:hypothetical protein [Actinophytocola sp.]|uniref:hypothetical protein n=1 Tax=Actinophytocola sp. TaxID=1872138 RepID=UPI002ED55F7A
MTYVIAAALLVGAVAILTLPWSRRDPADFTTAELGYAWRGPRGAVIGALRQLVDAGTLQPSRVRGMARTDTSLPSGTDPFTRAVYSATGVRRGPSALQEYPGVRKALPAVAERARAAGLRVGKVRRALGSAAALAAPVNVLVAHGFRDVTGIVVGVVMVLVAAWLVVLRGTTIAGTRTLGAAEQGDTSALRGSGRRGMGWGFANLSSGAGSLPEHNAPTSSFGANGDFGGGGDSSGY